MFHQTVIPEISRWCDKDQAPEVSNFERRTGARFVNLTRQEAARLIVFASHPLAIVEQR
jgi:hypothetical protein